MLNKFLSNSVCSLESLINISKLDIEDIKVANHDAIFARLESKNNLIAEFETNKNLAHEQMVALAKKYPNKNIADLLDDNTNELIDKMREQLKILRELNDGYSKSVVAVYEFYNSLIESIIPSERVGYSNKSYSKVDLLHIDA